jgi:uncharacterized protein (TIRG00374 family)
VASLLVVACTVWFVVVPQFTAARGALHSLEQVAVPLVVAALLLEVASLLSYSALTAVVLGEPRPRYLTLLRIDLTDLGVNHVVPGGGTTSGALRMRFFGRLGIPLADGFATATVEILGSNIVLGGIFATGIALSLATFAANGYYLTAGVAVLVVLATSGLGVWILVGHTDVAARAVRHVPLIRPGRAEAFVRTMAQHLRSFGGDPRRIVVAVALAAGNWVLDAAALGVVLLAFGHPASIPVLLTVYGLGSLIAMVPLTPGGLGLVEGVMVPAFVAFGVPTTTALLGVIGWRLLEYWMPLPVAVVAYVSLRLGPLRTRARRV